MPSADPHLPGSCGLDAQILQWVVNALTIAGFSDNWMCVLAKLPLAHASQDVESICKLKTSGKQPTTHY